MFAWDVHANSESTICGYIQSTHQRSVSVVGTIFFAMGTWDGPSGRRVCAVGDGHCVSTVAGGGARCIPYVSGQGGVQYVRSRPWGCFIGYIGGQHFKPPRIAVLALHVH